MMNRDNGDYNHFVCIVASDNPQILIREYDLNNTSDKPHVLYRYKDASKIRKNYIALYAKLLQNTGATQYERALLEEELDNIKQDDDTEFFYQVTQDYDHDENTGDAISWENQNGKYTSAQIGKAFSTPFLKKDGSQSFQAKKSEIDWDKMQNADRHIYASAWETVMEKREPKDELEEKIYENMKGMETYFNKFENKENYINSSCSFWGYAFLSESTGWLELEETMDQFKWIADFYNRFIEKLPENTLLTIYECRK